MWVSCSNFLSEDFFVFSNCRGESKAPRPPPPPRTRACHKPYSCKKLYNDHIDVSSGDFQHALYFNEHLSHPLTGHVCFIVEVLFYCGTLRAITVTHSTPVLVCHGVDHKVTSNMLKWDRNN